MRALLVAGSVAALCIGGCASSPTPSFVSDSAPGVQASAYRTYSWAFGDHPQGENALLKQRVMQALDSAFAAQGFQHVATGGDMVVAFTLGARDRVETTDWGPVGPYYPGWGRGYRYGWAYPYRDIDVRTVREGSLAMDIFDGRTEHPIWHGIATKKLEPSQVSDEIVTAAATGLVERFASTGKP